MTEYPRILVISAASINDRSGTGVTLCNLFRGWPQSRLAQICSGLDVPDANVCENYWRLGLKDVPADRRLRRFARRGQETPAGNISAAARALPGVGSRTLRARLSAWADLAEFELPDGFWPWIRSFDPQVILSNLASIRQTRLTSRVAGELRVPVVPFFHDDWPGTMYADDRLVAIPRRVLMAELARCLRSSTLGIGNSEEMAGEYAARFGLPFHAFMNCVDVGDYAPRGTGAEELNFTYVGGLHLGRSEALQDILEAISIAREAGAKSRLILYAPVADLALLPERLMDSNLVTIGGSVSGDTMQEVLRRADVLLHVESFDRAIRKYTRLSFSTKLPLYMSVGRPILAYGPAEGASIRHVAKKNTGIVVSEKGVKYLVPALVRLATNAGLRDQYGKAAWQQAKDLYAADQMRNRFGGVLTEAACAGGRLGEQARSEGFGGKAAS